MAHAETPLMKQYNQFKAKHPDAILLFRVGDFYETFGNDAITASKVLGIVLTKRANGSAQHIELAGFPHHSIDSYLPKLVRAGYRVAICEQLEDPKMAKGIVKRGVTELVTPGISINDKVLEQKENNFLGSIYLTDKKSGISFVDISTGEFYIAEGDDLYIDKLLQNFKPSEMVIFKGAIPSFKERFHDKMLFTAFEDWVFTHEFSYEQLTQHFQTNSLKGFGVDDLTLGTIAAGAAIHYLHESQNFKIQHINKIQRIEEENYVWLDRFTVRNLELVHSNNEEALTLLDVIDKTVTPMGSRMLRNWMVLPLKRQDLIEERLKIVDFYIEHQDLMFEKRELFKQIGDLERLVSKIATGKINPREVLQLWRALCGIEALQKQCLGSKNKTLLKLGKELNPLLELRDRIEREVNEDAPVLLNKGRVFNKGVDSELDELSSIASNSKTILSEIQQQESLATGITSLKIGFNNVFGYYLEVTNVHKNRVPEGWIRKQTLTSAERYITEELKEIESKILGAEDKILEIESRLYQELVASMISFLPTIQHNARLVARLDVLLSFSHISIENHYVKPTFEKGNALHIIGGRHPVIEKRMAPGEQYVSNDVYLDTEKQQIIIITGPNMSGKSALLRQTALIVLMAQMGCFVPAESVKLGIVDKIFTRVGASDNISTGESTFMVEMNETASILNNISDRSLILLDEIGRGTSTYDGVSIAWAIAEYLHESPQARAKVLFATHYHELNMMEDQFSRIKNFHVTVKEINNKILFLRKLAFGGSEHSFGIHVARMAGMPPRVLRRAEEVLEQLEKTRTSEEGNSSPRIAKKEMEYQLNMFAIDDPLLESIKEQIINIDIDNLTPIEALTRLNEIKKLLKPKK